MPEIPGADPRQSRTLQTLSHLAPPTRDALAAVALVLFDAINGSYLVVNDELPADQKESAGDLLDATYCLQDSLNGCSSRLSDDLALFLLIAEFGLLGGKRIPDDISGTAEGGAQ